MSTAFLTIRTDTQYNILYCVHTLFDNTRYSMLFDNTHTHTIKCCYYLTIQQNYYGGRI